MEQLVFDNYYYNFKNILRKNIWAQSARSKHVRAYSPKFNNLHALGTLNIARWDFFFLKNFVYKYYFKCDEIYIISCSIKKIYFLKFMHQPHCCMKNTSSAWEALAPLLWCSAPYRKDPRPLSYFLYFSILHNRTSLFLCLYAPCGNASRKGVDACFAITAKLESELNSDGNGKATKICRSDATAIYN